MASKSFTLADPEGGGKGPCAKLCMCTLVIAFVGIFVVVGVYFYNTNYGGACSAPELDEHGLSNWTAHGADRIAYACFPGFFLEGESNLVVAKCENATWNPVPPSCNSLPIRIDCAVNNQSIVGNITMWQHGVNSQTHITGRINYTAAVKPQGHLLEHVIISKRTCNVSHTDVPIDYQRPEPRKNVTDGEIIMENDPTATDDDDLAPGKLLKIQFNSSELKAFKKTELFMNIIFVDHKTTATLVSVHQENLTLVMTSSDPVHSLNSSWSWEKEKKALEF